MPVKHRHPGPCTEGTIYTKEQAHQKLTELGYTYNMSLFGWALPNGEGGRLEWTPDYCNPDAFDSGTAFQLRHPNGTITPIPMDETAQKLAAIERIWESGDHEQALYLAEEELPGDMLNAFVERHASEIKADAQDV